ncbi:MAG: peptide ABC transporter substrate-binding protein [Oscillospiraceae bacterium]|nr:peptide ABC transporter substrate-binding protein [Oscillospiraceae bacterium]
MYYPVASSLYSVDPQIAKGDTAGIIVTNTFDGLVFVNEAGEIACAAAESYTLSPDGLIYTFSLRKDGQWLLSSKAKSALKEKLPESFDARVTAYDFVFALRRAIAPETKADDAVLLSPIVNAEQILAGTLAPEHLGVRALSDFVLEIRLSQPQPRFLYTLARPVAMPCNEIFFEACGGRYGLSLEYTLSNGPFYFSRWREGISLCIAKNEDYTGARTATAEAAYLYVNTDTDDILKKLDSGPYNAAYLDNAAFAKLKRAEDYTVSSFENTVWAFVFNMADENFASHSLRRAVSLAINGEVLQSEAGQALAERMVPPFCTPSFSKTFLPARPVETNEDEAQRELNAALTELSTSSFEVTLLCAEEHEKMLRLQMQEWQRILGVNINVRLSPLPFDELKKAVEGGSYEFAFYPLTATGVDVQDFFKMFLSGNTSNILKMQDEAYDNAYKALLKIHDGQQLKEACSGLEKQLQEQTAYVPVFFKPNYLVMRKEVQGIYLYSSPDTVYFTSAKYRAGSR